MPPKPITQKNTNLQEKPISFLSTGECRQSIIAFIAEESWREAAFFYTDTLFLLWREEAYQQERF